MDHKTIMKVSALFSGAALTLGALVTLVLLGEREGSQPPTMALVVALVIATIVLTAIGVSVVVTARRLARGEAVAPTDYSHTVRLFGTFAVVLAAALVARALAVPSSFGDFGNYRGDAVAEARAVYAPRHQGKEKCGECHEQEAALHHKDVHRSVQCEVCHGLGDQHVAAEGSGPISVAKTKELCLTCHRRLLARPAEFPQIDWREHYRFVGVKDEGVECQSCHSAHEPLFLDTDLHDARLHPLIHRCRDCHVGSVDETAKRPDAHPAIFECSYCHKDVTADFASRPHHVVECTTCHLFIKESEFAGRIVKNSDRRFCLLCHKDAPFRSDSAAPSVTWPEHLKDVGDPLKDADKRCIDCHRDKIHAPHGSQKS